MNCFRFFDFKSFKEVDDLTFDEYRLMMRALRLRQVDMDYRNHLQAFLNFAVKAERKTGKNKSRPVYNTFRKFFNYEKAIEEAMDKNKKTDRFRVIKKFLEKVGAAND